MSILTRNYIPVPRTGPTISHRSNENPSVPVSAAWVFDAFGEMPSTTGVRINAESAKRTAAVYACTRILAESVASLPLFVYERLDRGKRKAPDNPLYRILHDAPNPEVTAFTFFEMQMEHAPLRGNCYSQIIRNGAGQPIALYPLHPAAVTPRRIGNELVYEVRAEGGIAFLAASDMLHVPMMPYDVTGLAGLGLVGLAKETIGLAQAAERVAGTLFSNGVNAKGVVSHPKTLSPKAAQNLRDSIAENLAGIANSNKPLILEEGMNWTQTTITPDEAQFLETRKFQVIEICRWFRIPPHMIADLERATFSNIEQQSIDFVQNALRPWLVRWEQELNRKLFRPGDPYFAEFNVDGLLRGDAAARAAFYGQGIRDGWLLRNEARERENLSAIEGLDEPLSPLNMTTGNPPSSDDAKADTGA